ncbi:hypothetical protein L596_028254 [Steinernema carpocapsae]|uniref:Uncharacterized protein n=1 Tax=Steinernema carpocapsae TaxID=34508 RepID=A0A4V5ZXU5_STECR|nr:hypothetical protein L596_028254 [Steinernema carpocapsae]
MIENQCPIGRISVKSSLGVKKLHKMLPSAFDSIHVTRRRKLVSPADAPSPIPRLSKHQQQQVVKEEKVTPEIDENQENRSSYILILLVFFYRLVHSCVL